MGKFLKELGQSQFLEWGGTCHSCGTSSNNYRQPFSVSSKNALAMRNIWSETSPWDPKVKKEEENDESEDDDLPDVFGEARVILAEGVARAERLRRYVVAFGGEVLPMFQGRRSQSIGGALN